MSRQWQLECTATFAAAALLWAALASAQDGAKAPDPALDQLLEKLDEAKKSDAASASKDSSRKSSSEAKKRTAPQQSKDSPPAGDKTKGSPSSGDAATQDQALDNLLEKLGASDETPSPDDRNKGPSRPDDKPGPSKGQRQRTSGELKGQVKELDEHLEELLGRKKKQKNREQEKDGEGSGPLGQVIKEMREVEGRLGKPDTGEETRKKQTEIVKKLDQIIDQLRSMSNDSQARRRMRLVMQQGQRPGSQSGQSQGSNGGNAPWAKPAKPDGKRALAGGKDEWGHLPDELRQEMDNVMKEEALPEKNDLVKRYYLSVSRKNLLREE